MTQPVVSITQTQIQTALRAFLLSVLPAGIPIIRGQDNLVPEPSAADFVVLTPIARDRLATNIIAYSDPYPATPSVRIDTQKTQITYQIDVHGPNSADNVTTAMALFRSDVACQFFAGQGYDVQPLYTSDPRQIPFIDGEQQYEDRWTCDLVMQANISIATPQQFAGTVDTSGIVNIESTYPP